jgi:hypothetical protein
LGFFFSHRNGYKKRRSRDKRRIRVCEGGAGISGVVLPCDLPVAQLVQLAWPVDDVYVPGGHEVQTEAPVEAAIRPTAVLKKKEALVEQKIAIQHLFPSLRFDSSKTKRDRLPFRNSRTWPELRGKEALVERKIARQHLFPSPRFDSSKTKRDRLPFRNSRTWPEHVCMIV